MAERLFDLLPPMMPLEAKFHLVESLWKHMGPSSKKVYYVGYDANIEEVSQRVGMYLDEVVTTYQIPSSMEARFSWLSEGDARVKQELLNYFRNLEKQLLPDALTVQLPVLLNHLRRDKGDFTKHAAQVLKVGKHEVQVIVNKKVRGISENAPQESVSNGYYELILITIGVIVLIWLLNR